MFDKKRNRNAFIMIFLQHTKSFARFDIRLEILKSLYRL